MCALQLTGSNLYCRELTFVTEFNKTKKKVWFLLVFRVFYWTSMQYKSYSAENDCFSIHHYTGVLERGLAGERPHVSFLAFFSMLYMAFSQLSFSLYMVLKQILIKPKRINLSCILFPGKIL